MTAPEFIVIGHGAQRAAYRRRDDLEALHDAAQLHQGGTRIGENVLVVARGAADGGRRGPVYADSGSGALVVPTGRAFVQFEPSTDAETRARSVARAGFRIASIPPYARDGAWLEPLSDDIGDALAKQTALHEMPGIVAVEPEVLRESR